MSPLAPLILKALRRWRRREERAEGPHGAHWHGLGKIRQSLGKPDKDAARGAVIELVAAGQVEVFEAANGVLYRSSAPLYLDMRAR